MSNINVLDRYVNSIPSIQNALDIFQGEWASLFPEHLGPLQAGNIPLRIYIHYF
jgi:hypothetical protein